MVGNSFVHDKRGSMTPQRVLRIFQAHGGKCYMCQRKLTARDDYDIEHIIALENGGTDDDANLAPCCEFCHSQKTAEDHGQASRGRKAAARSFVPSRFHKSRSWRR